MTTTLERVDYQDLFEIEMAGARSRAAEDWLRAMLEGAPLRLRGMLYSTWLALGLKLGPPWSEQRVLGWDVRRRTPDLVLVGADSRIGMPAELRFERHRDSLSIATLIQQDNPVARSLWARVEPQHRRVVPHVLGQVARRAPAAA